MIITKKTVKISRKIRKRSNNPELLKNVLYYRKELKNFLKILMIRCVGIVLKKDIM